MLFFVIINFVYSIYCQKTVVYADKKTHNNSDLLIINSSLNEHTQVIRSYKKARIPKTSKVQLSVKSREAEIQLMCKDIPTLLQSTIEHIDDHIGELHLYFTSNQSSDAILSFYQTELILLGWKTDLFSAQDPKVLCGSKPQKKIVIIIAQIPGGWFSKGHSTITVIIKEQSFTAP